FAASKTETWTMAIVLTAVGVDGILEAISAAFAFESVTTSACVHGAAPSITTAARDPIHARVRGLDIAVSLNADDGVPPSLFTGLRDAVLSALMVVSNLTHGRSMPSFPTDRLCACAHTAPAFWNTKLFIGCALR